MAILCVRAVRCFSVGALGLLAACAEAPVGELLEGVPAVVFAKRARPSEAASAGLLDLDDLVAPRRSAGEGGVFVLRPAAPDGELRSLTRALGEVDVAGLDVSFDGEEVVMALRRATDDHHHLYLASVDGARLRQLTFGDANDMRPVFVSERRVAFLTDEPRGDRPRRLDELGGPGGVFGLATVDTRRGDADRRLCATSLSSAADPFLLSDGRVGFARWDHLGPTSETRLFAVHADCTGLTALAGHHGQPAGAVVQAQELEPGVFVAVAAPRTGTLRAGALVRVDTRASAGTGGGAIDEACATYTLWTPGVPFGGGPSPTGAGRYAGPRPLPRTDRLLVSWADGALAHDAHHRARTAPDFELVLFDPATATRTLLYDDPEAWELDAVPVTIRDAPPAAADGPVPVDAEPALLGSVDVAETSLPELVTGGSLDGRTLADALTNAARVRVIAGASYEAGALPEFGLTLHEGATVLGEVPVHEDRSWAARVPGAVPLRLQALDVFGLAIRSESVWLELAPGETRWCGGCHEGRATRDDPPTGAGTLARQRGPADLVASPLAGGDVPWRGGPAGEGVAGLLERRCIACHGGGAGDPYRDRVYTISAPGADGVLRSFEVPYLGLSSGAAVSDTGDRRTAYPVSYLSLVLPSAMAADSLASGDVPPLWVVPGAARESRLIEVLNVPSERDASAWAWPSAPHPEDVGVALSREERLLLVRMADLGAQFWTPRTAAGGPAPTAASGGGGS